MTPLPNDADDRRGVRKGRTKAAARARRRASTPYLESLESRPLLSNVPGFVGPRLLHDLTAGRSPFVANEVLVEYKAGADEVQRAKVRAKSEAVLTELIH